MRRMAQLASATSGSAVATASIVSRAWMPKLRRRTNSLIKDLRASSRARCNRSAPSPGDYAIAIVKNAPAVPRCSPSTLGYLCPQECRHPLPGLVGAGDVVGGAAFVRKGMRSVIAIDLVAAAGRLQCPFEIVDRRGRAPIVPIGEKAFQRHTDLGRVGERLRRYPVKAHPGAEFRDMYGGGHAQGS